MTMKRWEYIVVQAYRTVEREGIGEVSELVHEKRVETLGGALDFKDSWTADGLTVSMAGKLVDEEGERLVVE